MTIIQKTNHTEEALANLVEQFKGRAILTEFLTVFVDQIQELEDVYFQIFENRTIDTAVGEQLDGLGEIIGEDREGRDDDEYRLALRVRILLNKCSGSPEQIIEIMSLATGGRTVHLVEWPHGAEALVDGDMEMLTTSAWTAGNSATLTKET